MELEGDDLSLGFVLGLLYEFTPRTRAGLVYQAETEATMSDTPSFSGLTPQRQQLLQNSGIFTQEVSIDTSFPATLRAGIYHEFESGSSFTLDVLWAEFSEFGLSEVRIGDLALQSEQQDFEDVIAVSAGYTWELNEQWKLSLGGLYLDEPIKDENRTLTFRLDSIWAVGAGIEYAWSEDRRIGVNLNYYDLGKGKTGAFDDQTDATLSGEFTERYAIGLDVTFRWIRR